MDCLHDSKTRDEVLLISVSHSHLQSLLVSRPTYRSEEKEMRLLSVDYRIPIFPDKTPSKNVDRTKGFCDPCVREIGEIFHKKYNYSWR